MHTINEPRISLARSRVRIRLAPLHGGMRSGVAFTSPRWPAPTGDETPDELAAIESLHELPLFEWRDAVKITHGGVVYEVVPIEHEGRPALIHYSETAMRGVLAHDERPLPRQYLAHTALAFLESGSDAAFGEPAPSVRPDKRRPDDETLLRIIRRAIADDEPARRVLADTYRVKLPTADDWLRYARRLPGADLPAPRGNRGRPRKQPTDPTIESER